MFWEQIWLARPLPRLLTNLNAHPLAGKVQKAIATGEKKRKKAEGPIHKRAPSGYNFFVKQKLEEYKSKSITPPEGSTQFQMAGKTYTAPPARPLKLLTCLLLLS